MKTAGIAELKAHLSELLAAVKAGEEVRVTERGRPVARIVPIPPAEDPEDGILELERAGLIQRPRRALGADFWRQPRAEDPEALVRAALDEEREGGW